MIKINLKGLAYGNTHSHMYSSTACTDGEVLLYNGSHVSPNFTQGTVLVCYNDSYGSVCDDYWDELEASVVCRQLGHISSSGSE